MRPLTFLAMEARASFYVSVSMSVCSAFFVLSSAFIVENVARVNWGEASTVRDGNVLKVGGWVSVHGGGHRVQHRRL